MFFSIFDLSITEKTNTMKKLTQKEIVLETVEYYRTHKRALDVNDVCKYLTEEGDMCAFGRCVINPSALIEGYYVPAQVDIEQILKTEYQGHDVDFWWELQRFHDVECHWTANELGGQDVSEVGKVFIFETFNIII